jgi:hypothetical protein
MHTSFPPINFVTRQLLTKQADIKPHYSLSTPPMVTTLDDPQKSRYYSQSSTEALPTRTHSSNRTIRQTRIYHNTPAFPFLKRKAMIADQNRFRSNCRHEMQRTMHTICAVICQKVEEKKQVLKSHKLRYNFASLEGQKLPHAFFKMAPSAPQPQQRGNIHLPPLPAPSTRLVRVRRGPKGAP